MGNEHPKVFISYSHEDETFEKFILQFSNHLRLDGIDASIDLYEDAPDEGWPRWMEKQIQWADYVLVIATGSYYEKFYNCDKGKGKGVSWEVHLIYQILYDQKAVTTKFIPVICNEKSMDYIPTPLKSYTVYNISTEKGYNDLYKRLLGIPKYEKPPLGEIQSPKDIQPLEPKRQRTMFFSTPINLEKWNASHWRGMIYLLQEGMIPVLGMLFDNYQSARGIFQEWRDSWGKKSFVDENLSITLIIPPFPQDCYVYKNRENSYGKGYFIYVGQNMEAAAERALKSGIRQDELLLTFVSRYLWVDEVNGSTYRDKFLDMSKRCGRFQLMPMGIKNPNKPFSEENLYIGYDVAVGLRNIHVKRGVDIDENDPCKVVFDENGEVIEA